MRIVASLVFLWVITAQASAFSCKDSIAKIIELSKPEISSSGHYMNAARKLDSTKTADLPAVIEELARSAVLTRRDFLELARRMVSLNSEYLLEQNKLNKPMQSKDLKILNGFFVRLENPDARGISAKRFALFLRHLVNLRAAKDYGFRCVMADAGASCPVASLQFVCSDTPAVPSHLVKIRPDGACGKWDSIYNHHMQFHMHQVTGWLYLWGKEVSK